MKTTIFLLFFTSTLAMAQERVVATGGEATGAGGTVSFSVGLIDYSAYSSTSGSISTGLQHVYIESVGIDEWDLSYDISVFPNPTIDKLTIAISENQTGLCYVLTDLNGKLVLEGDLTAIQNQVEISYLGDAMYFLNILNQKDVLRTFKIIKNQ